MAEDGEGNLVASREDQLTAFGTDMPTVVVADGTINSGEEPALFVLF